MISENVVKCVQENKTYWVQNTTKNNVMDKTL